MQTFTDNAGRAVTAIGSTIEGWCARKRVTVRHGRRRFVYRKWTFRGTITAVKATHPGDPDYVHYGAKFGAPIEPFP